MNSAVAMSEPGQRDPILVWGAGAIGGVLAAYWARAGHPVSLVDIDQAHVNACRTSGLVIEGPIEPEFSQTLQACLPHEVSGSYTRIVLAVKAQATLQALEQLLPHLAEAGYVLSAQNGLNEHIIADYVGPDRTVGAFVNFGADYLSPGRILYGNRGAVVVGELDGRIRERTTVIYELLREFEPEAVLSDDIWSYLWGKLGYGAMLFATALTDDSMSATFSDPDRVPVLMALAREVAVVAAAENVSPRGFNGYDPKAFDAHASDAQGRSCIEALARFTARTAKTHSGIYRDLAVRKRRTEVDPQLTAIIDIADHHGIAVPCLIRLVRLIHDLEEGRRELSAETFAELSRIAGA